MLILGINAGHCATACLAEDGRVVGCVSEERFSRIKNHAGLPLRSIQSVLREHGASTADLDAVVMDNNLAGTPRFGDWFLERYRHPSLWRRLAAECGYRFPRLFGAYLDLRRPVDRHGMTRNAARLGPHVAGMLGVEPARVHVIHHHLAHALAPCFNLPRGETLVFTLDGEGDRVCASVNVFDGQTLRVLARTDRSASLGYLYGLATLHLGMKPLEHEFKVMGLAPYARQEDVDPVYETLRGVLGVDDTLRFRSRFHMHFADRFFARELRHARFDAVAGAVQRLSETLVTDWVRLAIGRTGIRRIAVSGGVFMNVKINKVLAELPEVEHLFVMPSCGDESNAIGSCLYGYRHLCDERGVAFEPTPLRSLYLGPDCSRADVDRLIRERDLGASYEISEPADVHAETAALLARGDIVARCAGRSEWGARALGHRSILAHPGHAAIVRTLNTAIKGRDFWMPFAPSILSEDAARYLRNPSGIDAPYMSMAFDATSDATHDLPAAMHPYDRTMRPQVVCREWSPDYHRVISRFRELTGIGGVLNTSFNVHGEPNVLTPEDALHTMDVSGLEYLVLGTHLLKKRRLGARDAGPLPTTPAAR
ncbi:MAG: carbamoyltransferase C-terminal domain-containing protein [Vicinamibacterales bacterium]